MFLHKINLHPAIRLPCWVKKPIVQYNAPNEFENYNQKVLWNKICLKTLTDRTSLLQTLVRLWIKWSISCAYLVLPFPQKLRAHVFNTSTTHPESPALIASVISQDTSALRMKSTAFSKTMSPSVILSPATSCIWHFCQRFLTTEELACWTYMSSACEMRVSQSGYLHKYSSKDNVLETSRRQWRTWV